MAVVDADKTEVWPNIAKMLIPGDDSYLNELAMTANGYPNLNNPMLAPTDIIRQIATDDYYQGLITELKNNGYEENKNLFVFPYDWRWFLNWSAAEDPFSAIQSLKEKIDQVKLKTGAMKVNIIAHSLGGLAAKYYLIDNQEFSHDEFFTPEYEITDSYSGVATSSLALLLDGQPISQTEQNLFYYSLGQHIFKITVSDLAGNRAEASVKFTVNADLDSTINDVNHSYSLGWISEKKVRN